jgi:iron complex transport system permease protein
LSTTRATVTFCLLGIAAMCAIGMSLSAGSVHLDVGRVWGALRGASDPLADMLVNQLRLPRTLSAFAVGGILAVAGALMQVLLRNPLADPYVMGVSGGAAVAALGAILLGASGLVVDASATAGALAAMLLVFALAHGSGGWTSTRLLLTGVVIAAGCGAVISLMLALGGDASLRGMVFWLMGDVSSDAPAGWLFALLAAVVATGIPLARHLNVLARGDVQARLVGLPVNALRIGIFTASSLLTAASVTAAGTIGFVGLVTPHLARLMLGTDHRRVLPAAALIGGTLVTCADMVARTAFAPRLLPVGALTALIGVPLFLVLMRRTRIST